MIKNLSQTPKTVGVIENITLVQARTTVKNTIPKIARSPRQNLDFPPTTAIDTHSVMVKRDRIHPFAQNTFTRREKSLFHPGCETYPTIRCESVNSLTSQNN